MDMEKRLARVERQCRLYRNLFVLAGVIVVALVSFGAEDYKLEDLDSRIFTNEINLIRHNILLHDGVEDVIRARKFEVVSEKGKPVAWLTSYAKGGSLQIDNSKGEAVILAQAGEWEHGQLTISQPNGTDGVVMMGSDKRGKSGVIQVRNKTTETIIQIQGDVYGNGELAVLNRKGMGRTLKPGPQ